MSGAAKGKPKSAQMRERLSAATTGVPKLWARGAGNPNFGNAAQGQPEARARFLAAVKQRGQVWTEDDRARHADRMRGPCNAMRGRKHTAEAIAQMSAAKRRQYCEGTVRIRKYKLSRAERTIADHLRALGLAIQTQFHIKGIPFLYDFVFPDRQLIVEYQGNYWHANPTLYQAGEILSFHGQAVCVDDIWERDAAKRLAAQQAGYRVEWIWEADYKVRGMEAILCLL